MNDYLNKKQWLDVINNLAYEGKFEDAQEIINEGLKKYKLTKKDASDILESASIDVRYWFVKPLVDIGGKFPDCVVEFAKEVFDGNNTNWHLVPKIPGAFEGLKLVIETVNKNKSIKQKGGQCDERYAHKYFKYKQKYLQLKNNTETY